MTAAPTAASATAPIAPAPTRAAPQPSSDRFAFAVVLDSLPGAPGKADASTAEEQAHRSNESPQEQSRGQTARHSLLSDSAVLASLPFALRAAAMLDEPPHATDDLPSLASPAAKGLKSEDSGASPAAGTKAAVGRLTGERAFHLGAIHDRRGACKPRLRNRPAIRSDRRPALPREPMSTARAVPSRAFREPRLFRQRPWRRPFPLSQRRRLRAGRAACRSAFDQPRERHASGFA